MDSIGNTNQFNNKQQQQRRQQYKKKQQSQSDQSSSEPLNQKSPRYIKPEAIYMIETRKNNVKIIVTISATTTTSHLTEPKQYIFSL